MHAYRTHTCGVLRLPDEGAEVRLSGWIHRKRDHGGLLFVDLRDHYGLTQLVAHPGGAGFAVLDRARPESVVTIDGVVVARTLDTVNPNLPTGEVEIKVSEATVLSEAADLPLPVFGEPDYPEEIRLTHRYLDLRRETLHRNIVLRSKVIDSIRRRMIAEEFTEFQTPILTASSPEGARDFLVPARNHPGRFYALPQAPQQFKQLLMVAGFDRYFQIAPCFRDEDARADRSLEFYQLDVEMSFVTQEDVFAAIEPVLHGVFEEFAGDKPVTPYPFPRIAWRDAIARYGTDKPRPAPIRSSWLMSLSTSAAAQLWPVRPHSGGARRRGLGDPGPGRRIARLLRPDERLGPGRGASRALATCSGAPRRAGKARAARPAPSPATSARSAQRRSASSWAFRSETRSFSSAAIPRPSTGSPVRRAPRWGASSP